MRGPMRGRVRGPGRWRRLSDHGAAQELGADARLLFLGGDVQRAVFPRLSVAPGVRAAREEELYGLDVADTPPPT